MYKYAHTHTHICLHELTHIGVCVCVNKFLGFRQLPASKKDEWNKIQGSISFQLAVDDAEMRYTK